MKQSKRGGVRKTAPKGQKYTKRSRVKYPYLDPNNSLLIRKEETEDVASYTAQLNDSEKEWMNQFMKEYVNADTTNAQFHTTQEERKICYDKNNARNRCWYSKETAQNRLNLVGTDRELEVLLYGEQNEEIGNDQETEEQDY